MFKRPVIIFLLFLWASAVLGCSGIASNPPTATPTSLAAPSPAMRQAAPSPVVAMMTHGPLAGAVSANTATIWVRTNEPAHVKIEYADNASFTSSHFSAQVVSDAKSDFTLHIPLDGLTPETTYYTNVWVENQKQSQMGRFKTFPLQNTSAPLKLVVLSDFGYADVPPNAKDPVHLDTFSAADAENPDLVFIGGDFDHRDPKLLPDKRKMFKDLYADDPKSPVYDFTKFILHRYPLAHQWDDHDYGADNSDRNAVFRGTALQVFQEYFPAYPLGKYGIYQSFQYGKDVEIFVLDNRSQRDSNHLPDDDQKSMLNGEHHPDGQMQWLLDGLKNSTATWKLILSSSAFSNSLKKGDSWARFTYERHEIIDFVNNNKIGGVVVIAGDLHGGAMDDGTNAGLPSVVVPSVNLFRCFTVPELKVGKWSNGIFGDPSKQGKNTPCDGYAVVTLDGTQGNIQIKDSEGNVKLQMALKP